MMKVAQLALSSSCPWDTIGSSSNDDDDGTRTAKKKNNKRFRLAKQQPCTSITLYAHSLPSLRDYDVNLPHLTFFWRTSTQDNDPLLLLLNFDTIVYNPTPDKFANIWRIERDGINAMKFEPARTHFLTDVFVAVAVIVAEAPYCK